MTELVIQPLGGSEDDGWYQFAIFATVGLIYIRKKPTMAKSIDWSPHYLNA